MYSCFRESDFTLYQSCRSFHICNGASWYYLKHAIFPLPRPCRITKHAASLAYLNKSLCRTLSCSPVPNAMRTISPHHQLALLSKRASRSDSPLPAPKNTVRCPVVLPTFERTPFGASSLSYLEMVQEVTVSRDSTL